jgi:hypothetical protein
MNDSVFGDYFPIGNCRFPLPPSEDPTDKEPDQSPCLYIHPILRESDTKTIHATHPLGFGILDERNASHNVQDTLSLSSEFQWGLIHVVPMNLMTRSSNTFITSYDFLLVAHHPMLVTIVAKYYLLALDFCTFYHTLSE